MRPPLCSCDLRGCIAICTCTKQDKELWEEPWSDRLPADEESSIRVWAREICQLATERIAELKRETHATGEASEYQAE